MSKAILLATSVAVSITGLGACKTAGTDPKIRADMTAKLQSAQPGIQACYQNALYTKRKLRGMMVVQLAAAADTGAFVDINVRRDEPADPVLKFCVVQELAKLKLDKPPGQRINAESIPIKFEWSNP